MNVWSALKTVLTDAAIFSVVMCGMFFLGMIPVWLASWTAFVIILAITAVLSLAFALWINPDARADIAEYARSFRRVS